MIETAPDSNTYHMAYAVADFHRETPPGTVWRWQADGEDTTAQIIQDNISDFALECAKPPVLAFADPPYGYGLKYDSDTTKDRPGPEWIDLINWTLETFSQNLIEGGTAWLMLPDDRHREPFTEPASFVRIPNIIWLERFAQYQGRRGLTVEHRHVLRWGIGTKNHARWNPDAILVESVRQKMKDKRANPAGRVPGTVWETRRLQGNAKARVGWHPAQLPPEPLERIVKGWSCAGDTVLEAFAGSGSLARVCIKLKRHWLGIEQSQDYCQRIMARLLEEFGGTVTVDLAPEASL